MGKEFNSDHLRGHIDTIILKALFEGEKYGWEICREIEKISKGTFVLKQPSLYSSLKRLAGANLVTSYLKDSAIGGRRRYYTLTQSGRQRYEDNKTDWAHSQAVINHLINFDASIFKGDFSSYFDKAKSEIQNEKNEEIEELKEEISALKTEAQQLDLLEAENNTVQNSLSAFEETIRQYNERLAKLEEIPSNTNIESNVSPLPASFAESEFKTTFIPAQTSPGNDFKFYNQVEENPVINLEIKKEEPVLTEPDAIFLQQNEKITNEDSLILNNVYFKKQQTETEYNSLKNHYLNEFNEDYFKQDNLEIKGVNYITNTQTVTHNPQPQTQDDTLKYNIKAFNNKQNNDTTTPILTASQFVNYNKLLLTRNIILTLVMVLEICATYIILKKTNLFIQNDLILFIIAGTLVGLLLVTSIIFYAMNPHYKKNISKIKNNYFIKLLTFIVLLSFLYSLNVFMGMTSLTQIDYIAKWLLPTVLATNILVSALLYDVLKHNKNFYN